MTFTLPMLYHWSPTERRARIINEGLRLYSEPTVQSGQLCWHYICLGFTPSGAWNLSGDFAQGRDGVEIEQWDLWQVVLPDNADTHIRPEFGYKVQEVKVYTPIPADHIWWVAQRDGLAAIDLTE